MAARLQASFAELAAERDALRRFVADASHELRTPITALRTFNELLQGPATADPAAQAEFLAESQDQIERLEWITRNLLDLSRLEAGIAALELDTQAACELLETAAAPFFPTAHERGIRLALAPLLSSLPIRCDRARIIMALTNLLDNALKFTPAGGQIEAGVALVATTSAAANDGANSEQHSEQEVCFWVQDTGMGIAPEELPLIFERFHRSLRAARPGSGLGLAIVQSIVQAHGGRVEVASQVDAGSRFALCLPANHTSV
jgi:signal transduction histidine kinase